MAGVKVIDGEGNEIEVSAADAQAGYAAGRYSFADEKVRVVSGDNRTGYVHRDDLGSALADGWDVGSEAEAEAKQLRREASGVGGTLAGSAEALARGASLGVSDVALSALGVDQRKAKARQEALGGAGTALEVVGGIAATIGTGGTGGAAQVAGRAGAAAGRAGMAARLAGRTLAAPSRLAARGGAALERTILGEAATVGAGTRIGARAAGEALDGALGGLGGAVSESVLHDKDVTAEALLGGTLAGAAFGGAVGGATGTAGGVAGRLLRGVDARRGGEVGDAAMRKVLARDVGVDPSEVPDALVEAARKTDHSRLGQVAEQLAPLSNADPAIAKRVYSKIAQDPKRWSDVFNRKGEIEREVAETIQDGLGRVRTSLDEARRISGGEAKYRALGKSLPDGANDFSPRLTEELRNGITRRLDDMEAENAKTFARSYDPGALREVRKLVGRATEEAGTADAAASFRAMDRLKRDLAEEIRRTGGFGKPPRTATTDTVATNKALREVYDEVKTHLEREDLWGAGGAAQREINAAYAKSARMQSEFRDGATGTGLRSLFQQDGSINMRQALTLARQFQRMGGDEVVNRLDEALESQLDYLRTVQRHYDLGAEGAARIKAAEDAVAEVRRRFQAQAENADFLADAESLRVAEGNRSVSIGTLSGVGPTLGALAGGAAAGPLGAAAGVVAGGILRPYSTARSMASLLTLTDGFAKKFSGPGLVTKLRKRWAPDGAKAIARARGVATRARREALAAGRGGVRAAAFQVGRGTARERLDRTRKLSERVVAMSSPESIKKAMGPELEVLALDAPETAAAIEVAVQRAAQYLQATAPKIQINPYSGKPGHVNPREIDQWLRRRGAVIKPAGVLDRVIEGTVTREEIETLRTVYPRHYAMMVDGITQAVADEADKGRPLPERARLGLGRYLDVPLDESHTPERIMVSQVAFGHSSQPTPEEQMHKQSQVRAAGADEIDPEQLQTRTQAIA